MSTNRKIILEGYLDDAEVLILRYFQKWCGTPNKKEEEGMGYLIMNMWTHVSYKENKFRKIINALMSEYCKRMIIPSILDRASLILFVVMLYIETDSNIEECLNYYFDSENPPEIISINMESKREPKNLRYKIKLEVEVDENTQHSIIG